MNYIGMLKSGFRCIGPSGVLWTLCLLTLSGCSSGLRDLDFVSKTFTATVNIDSTRGIDSTDLDGYIGSKSLYSFEEKGIGTNHVQMGILSKDTPFRWKVSGDSLYMDKDGYVVERKVKGFILRSDSAKIYLYQQP
jgi:hypothetical protein